MSALVIFDSGGCRFALRRDAVSRILPTPRLTRPPQAPGALAGFFAFGPDVVTVLGFAALTGGAEANAPGLYDHVILLKGDGPLIALFVDRVFDVVEADEKSARPVASGGSHRDCIVATITTRKGDVLLLDHARMIADYERDRVRHFHAAERERRRSLGDAA